MSLGHLPPRLSDAEALALGRLIEPELGTIVRNIILAAGVREGARLVDELPYVCALIRAGRGAGDTVWAEIGRRIGLPESVVRWVKA